MDYLLKVQLSHSRSVRSLQTWHEVGHLQKAIHDYNDGIISVDCAGQFEHKVHTHVTPRSHRQLKRCVEPNIFLYLLGEGAHPRLSDDVPNITPLAQPVELMFYRHNHLVIAEVAGKTSQKALPSELIPERRAWNAQPIPK